MHDIERHPLIGKDVQTSISSLNSYKLFELMQDGKFILLIHPTYIDKINKINIDSHKGDNRRNTRFQVKNIDAVLIRPDGHIATIEYTKIDNCE